MRPLSVWAVENLDQGQKSEGASSYASVRWNILTKVS